MAAGQILDCFLDPDSRWFGGAGRHWAGGRLRQGIGDALELRPEARYEQQVSAPDHAITGYAYDNPCYAPAVPGVSTCTFGSGGRSLTFDQNGGKRSQAMIAMDAIFHF